MDRTVLIIGVVIVGLWFASMSSRVHVEHAMGLLPGPPVVVKPPPFDVNRIKLPPGDDGYFTS